MSKLWKNGAYSKGRNPDDVFGYFRTVEMSKLSKNGACSKWGNPDDVLDLFILFEADYLLIFWVM